MKGVSPEETPGSYAHAGYDGQSTDDSLLRKDKGEERKPRTRPSKADGSPVSLSTSAPTLAMVTKVTVYSPELIVPQMPGVLISP